MCRRGCRRWVGCKRARERSGRSRSGRGKEYVGESRRARSNLASVGATPSKRLLVYAVLHAQSVIGAVGGLSEENTVACAEDGVLGELPGNAEPGSDVVFVVVQRCGVQGQRGRSRIGLGRSRNVLQVVANAEIQRKPGPQLPSVFEIEAEVVVVKVVFADVRDWIIDLSESPVVFSRESVPHIDAQGIGNPPAEGGIGPRRATRKGARGIVTVVSVTLEKVDEQLVDEIHVRSKLEYVGALHDGKVVGELDAVLIRESRTWEGGSFSIGSDIREGSRWPT